MSQKIAKPLVKSMLMAIASLPISEAMAANGWQKSSNINNNVDNISDELKSMLKKTLSEKDSIQLINNSVKQLLLFADGNTKFEEKIFEDLKNMGLSASLRYNESGISGTTYFVRPRPTAMWAGQNLSGWDVGSPEISCHFACHGACHGSRGWR